MKLGPRVREERRRHGWDQAELARRLGVGQQAVSRWEHGLSRPRRNMVGQLAKVLGVGAADLLAAAGYVAPTADTPEQVSRPVRPQLTVLPLSDLAPDRFEELIADIAQHLHPSAHVSRFGGQGHTQYGVDVVAQQGDHYVAAYQCKRHQNFGPQRVREAVQAATIDADEYVLVLSRPAASPASRSEIRNHDGWALWDAEDLSRVVRTRLDRDAAVRVVDTYFPGWREPLLGVSDPGPWLDGEEFFRPLGGSGVYSHDWQLVGRTDQLADIFTFLDADDAWLGLLIGRGGIGKSRLLRAVADGAVERNVAVRFLTVGVDLSPAQLELLPSGRLLVVVDDAHDRTDLTMVVSTIARLRPEARVLLALRPYGLGPLTGDLRALGMHPIDLPTWQLPDLAQDEAEQLAREALGSKAADSLVRQLGRLTADCPLITVVAGVLIQRGQLDPACLDHEENVRTEILRAFRDALVADPLTGDPALRRGVLDALAVLQPFRSDDPAFQQTLAYLVDQPYDRVISHLRGLEDAGVLLRRGGSLRIVPDLLGDVILAEACFDDRSGAATGYVERAQGAADGQPLQHVFVNVSHIDWQIHHDEVTAPSLVTTLWEALNLEMQQAGILGRQHLLKLLGKVAYFEPERTLSLVRWLIDNPTDRVEDTQNPLMGMLLQPTYEDVLHELPPLLRGAAYNLSYLPRAVDTLWELAQPDTRPTNQFPDHALRVLRHLAEFGVGKPIAYNEAVVEAAERWLATSVASRSAHSPFDVLEPMLATEVTDESFRSNQLLLRTFPLDPELVRALRERVIGLAFREAPSPDVRRAVRAIGAIQEGIRPPIGLYGRDVTADERMRWIPDFARTIERLGVLAADEGLDPVVIIAIRQAVHWHAAASHPDPNTHEVARRVLDGLPDSLEHRTAFVLFDGWGHLVEGWPTDYQTAQAEKRAQMESVAAALTATYRLDELVDLLITRLNKQEEAFGRSPGSPGQFIWTLVSAEPTIGTEICTRLVKVPTGPLLQVLAVALAVLAESTATEAVAAAKDLLETEDESIRQQVANALGWHRDSRTLASGEAELLAELAHDADPYIRTAMAWAAIRLAPHDSADAVTLLTEIPFADSNEVADSVLQAFTLPGGLQWVQVPEERAERLIAHLRDCPSIEDHSIMSFLADISAVEPATVVDLLKARVERWEALEPDREYRALPFHWGPQLRIRDHPDLHKILQGLFDWIATGPNSWQRRHAGGELFRAVAQDFDADVISILDEAISAATPSKMTAVAAVLQQAPRSMIFENIEFIKRVLVAATSLGDECAQRVGGAMHIAVSNRVQWAAVGEPSVEDTQLRDVARRIADRLPQGSIEQRFYRSLQQSAEQTIVWLTDRDDLFSDGRDW